MSPFSESLRGALYMMLCMADLILNDALMKSVASDLSVFQANFLRGLVATTLIGLLAAQRGMQFHRVARTDRLLVAMRLMGVIGCRSVFSSTPAARATNWRCGWRAPTSSTDRGARVP